MKRKVIQRHLDDGLFPYTKRFLGTLRNHFSTIGVNGLNEMVRNFTQDREDITSTAGRALALRILDRTRARLVEFQEATGHMYNLEATPAEGATYRFAVRTASVSRAYFRPARRMHPTTLTPLRFLSVTRMIPSWPWSCRRSSRANTRAVPYSTST
jgi:hypothetical protein